MKLYIHEGPGHYIGSKIIVYAGSKTTAEKLIECTLISEGLLNEPINITKVIELDKRPMVIHSDNGDY